MSDERPREECPSCGGRGKKIILPRRRLIVVPPGDSTGPEPVALENCALCAGTGRAAA
ncbi:hypothetical protein ACRYCC_37870 [Actinomadura scrupuli]|uniref:hypothetical protein n=1 Tax=Actinomadura scrupuli TaxID=559629 RepID=UPI003D97B8BE